MKVQIINFRTLIAGLLAAFATSACESPPKEPKRQSGELVTDSSGCTYWKDSANPGPKTCLAKDASPPKP